MNTLMDNFFDVYAYEYFAYMHGSTLTVPGACRGWEGELKSPEFDLTIVRYHVSAEN